MNKDFLYYYNLELQHLRELGGEFAKANPKIAGRLNLDEFSCEDPYVERLLEGFSYLAARVHQKQDAGYPRLCQALLDNLFPDYLMSVPSMGIVKLDPVFSESVLLEGVKVKRGTKLRSISSKGIGTCQFVTAHEVNLWPIEISGAGYYTDDMSYLGVEYSDSSKSCACIEIDTISGVSFSALKMDDLDLYLRSSNLQTTMGIYELMLSCCTKIIVQPKDKDHEENQIVIDNSSLSMIKPIGFDIKESLYPYNPKTFEGYRLFRKYFVLPQSFMFLKIKSIGDSLRKINSNKVKIIFVFDDEKQGLKRNVKKSNFNLFCTPIVNLFEKTLSRIHLTNSKAEFHIVGERTEPMDFEILKVLEVKGYHKNDSKGQVFRPLYSASGFFENESKNRAYYSLNRVGRTLSESEQENGTRTGYVGTETYISIVDQDSAPYDSTLAELEIKALCSNRDLPLLIPSGMAGTDFTFDSNLPIKAIKFVHGPTVPYCEHLFTSMWEVINHISMNYLTLQDEDGHKTGEVIRNILSLYALSDVQRKYIKGLKKIKITPDTYRYSQDGMFTFLNGLSIEAVFEEALSSNDNYLLGMILDKFFENAAPVNIFTKTSLRLIESGKVIKWPVRIGTFQMI